MKLALIAPPFIPVPPPAYGGTELFIAHLAEELTSRGHEVIVYANGESKLRCEVRWLYPKAQWPPSTLGDGELRHLNHCAWALRDAEHSNVDLVHLNDALALPLASFLDIPAVHTLHHPHDADLSGFYCEHADVTYVTISHSQAAHEHMPRLHTIHHGIRLADYFSVERKSRYLSFLGRIAPMKGTHLAIQVAKRTGIPLKIAGEIQPVFRDYWEREIEPNVDGRLIEYVGQAGPATKNDLLGNALALLFPIQWDEPFGLVMIEAMACGTPVLALPGGAVEEIVQDGVSGWICHDIAELSARARGPDISAQSCRAHVERHFSVERMAENYERVYRSLAGQTDSAVPAVLRLSETLD